MIKTLVLQKQLHQLEQKHRILDDAIAEHLRVRTPDILEIQRLKRQKLALKDEIAALRKKITPDTLA